MSLILRHMFQRPLCFVHGFCEHSIPSEVLWILCFGLVNACQLCSTISLALLSLRARMCVCSIWWDMNTKDMFMGMFSLIVIPILTQTTFIIFLPKKCLYSFHIDKIHIKSSLPTSTQKHTSQRWHTSLAACAWPQNHLNTPHSLSTLLNSFFLNGYLHIKCDSQRTQNTL